MEAQKYKWINIYSHRTKPLLVLIGLHNTMSPMSPRIVLHQTTQETSDLKNVMRIGMDAVQIIQNSYLEAQLMIDLVLFLTSPIWVGLPSIFSNLSSESGVRVDIDRF